ncbi:MAG: hypothetical protein ACFFD4_34880, partial [Candidatus Odinarchaeota archaeon]
GFTDFMYYLTVFIAIIGIAFLLWNRIEIAPLLDFKPYMNHLSNRGFDNYQVSDEFKEVTEIIEKWLISSDTIISMNPYSPNHYPLLADKIAGYLARNCIEDNNTRIPLLIDLINVSGNNIIEKISNYLINECNIKESPSNWLYFKKMHEDGNLVLIFKNSTNEQVKSLVREG